MELWIRSQDKSILTKINEDIYIYDNSDKTSTIKTDKWQLGTYATKERALEVLDEIQNILMPPITALANKEFTKEDMKTIIKEDVVFVRNDTEIKPLYDDYVYEMPNE